MSKQAISLERPRKQATRKAVSGIERPIAKIVEKASEVIAPLWPISTFIARHPWMELEYLPFSEVAERFQRMPGIHLYPTMASFRAALEKGEIDLSFLERKLHRWLDAQNLSVPRHEAERLCRAFLWNDEVPAEWLASSEWNQLPAATSWRNAVIQPLSAHNSKQKQRLDQQMIKWCKLFLDEGQAAWGLPFRELGLFGAWRQLVGHDPALTKDERQRLFDWPSAPELALQRVLSELNVDEETAVNYLEAHLLALPGWAGMLLWRSKQTGQDTALLVDYLAIRLSLEWALMAPDLPLDPSMDDDVADDWRQLLVAWLHWGGMTAAKWQQLKAEEQCARLAFADRFWRLERYRLWLEAWEETYEEQLKTTIRSSCSADEQKPAAQFLFCIDVRSEVFRRHLEEAGPFETYGCAGFFGIPIKTRELDSHHTHPSCPAIVQPQQEICEVAAVPESVTDYRRRRNMFRFAGQIFKKVKQNLLASLLLPEMSGSWLGLHTLMRSAAPKKAGHLFRKIEETMEKKPSTALVLERQEKSEASDLPIGFSTEEKIQYVQQLLHSIGLTSSFAPLVIVCGHESATVNNPYASSLDCGACGGAAGAFNARVFAALGNLPEVREGLAQRGIVIPDETVFVAAEHVTTIDELRWIEIPVLSESAQQAFHLVESVLPKVSRNANEERCAKLPSIGKRPNDAVAEVQRRAVDWSEIRPEWGLAGNAAFVIGSRIRTKHCHLDGRVFLHSYDWRQDPTGELLSGIISGPATVGQWINLQYYASTVAPHYYGSGSKTTQTVTSGIGVMQGNASDLLTGLPWQSVAASDQELFHSPLRLLVVIEAPRYYIERLLTEHLPFSQKVKNGWLRLASIDPDSGEWVSWGRSLF
ncbi:DUF2309 domain-containing protein [Anoxybacillus rupiensis]|uniref:Probable inorganic carbon transporter subunit DabA n=1 Tax=Anoxybacteroides rupiense TaxID=311460 RepID=A0ABT5W5Q8_9BACL|nr:DUF2309 domain-containing protein [Anoxybacillus rupiensis]MBS2771493.1 DUF2309 domain-containing protein [Anoxybacillus rupiensis]MDE8564663.1 DUF2309 domain-containing protein [Anoxybacillus rupiensis]